MACCLFDPQNNADLLSIRPLGTNLNLNQHTIIFTRWRLIMNLKILSAVLPPLCLSFSVLTHCSLAVLYGIIELVNICSGKGLLPDGVSSVRSYGIHLKAISQEMLKISVFDMSLKMSNLRLQPHLPGANELTMEFHFFLTKYRHGNVT